MEWCWAFEYNRQLCVYSFCSNTPYNWRRVKCYYILHQINNVISWGVRDLLRCENQYVFFFLFSFFFLVLCANYLSVSHLCGFRLSFERKKNLLMHCSSSTLQGGNDTEVKIGQGSSKQPGIWLARTCARLKFSRQWVTATHGQPKCVRSLASASGLQREDPCWVLMQLPYPR